MEEFEFDHLKDLTFRVISQVQDDLVNYLKNQPSENQPSLWDEIVIESKNLSPYEFVFKYDILFQDKVRSLFLKTDLNGRKIKKASTLYNQDFENDKREFESDYYDSYDEVDFKKAIKYCLYDLHDLILELY